MKIVFFLFTFTLSVNSFAQMPQMSVKERLRISLWTEGLNDQIKSKNKVAHKPKLPEELERAIRKF